MPFDGLLELGGWRRAVVIVSLAVGAHLGVQLLRWAGERFATIGASRASLSKWHTVVSLFVSTAIFAIYFAAIGMALAEFGVSITAYLASASVIGLAVGFGSQGIVQDVVTGLTVIFSDLFDIGDLVEISGQVGIVARVGMRFTVLTTPLGAAVYIPNRTINNVINYPRGYVRCLVDVTLPEDPEQAKQAERDVVMVARSAYEQFPGIHRRAPDSEGRFATPSGRHYLRYKFRIWPGRGAPIETTFKQELLVVLRATDPDYPEWKIAISYEIEGATSPRPR